MKRILFLIFPFLPYLATAQVAKDTVTVLTLAQIPAGAIRDTTNITFVQDNAFNKARFDSLARYVTSKLIGDRGDITVSGSTGLTWELDAGVVDSMQLSAGAVVLPGAKVTGTLPVSKGGTGQSSLAAAGIVTTTGGTTNRIPIFNGTTTIGNSFVYRQLVSGEDCIGINEQNPSNYSYLTIGGSAGGQFGMVKGNKMFGYFATESAFGAGNSDTTLALGNFVRGAEIVFITRPISGDATSKLWIKNNGNIGIGTSTVNYKLDVNGNFRADSIFTDIAGNAVFSTSDARLKKNIEPVPSMLQKITALNPVTYEWNDLKVDQAINRDNTAHLYGKKIGLIAQEVYEVFPDFVGTDADGNMVLSYGAFIVPMLKAIQEQQQQIEALKARITQLENK